MKINKPRCWEVNQRTSAVVGMRSNESLNQEASFVMRVTVEWSLRGKIDRTIIWIWDMNKRKDLTPKFLAWLSNQKLMVLGNKGSVVWFKLQIWWAMSFRQCEFLGLELKRAVTASNRSVSWMKNGWRCENGWSHWGRAERLREFFPRKKS